MRHALDLTQCAFKARHGDLLVFGSWFGDKLEPCLAITETYRLGLRPVVPCVVPLSAAFAWDEHRGDILHTAATAAIFADKLGLDPLSGPVRVVSLIREHLGDLISMPPKPAERVVVADAIRTDADGREHHTEISEAM